MDAPLPNALADLFATAPVDEGAKARVHAMMSGADRFYHGLDHIALLWTRHRQFASKAGVADARDDRLVASAILFHDCIYAAGRPDNEMRSADLWLEAAQASGVPLADRTWVADTIHATRDHLAVRSDESCGPETRLRAWMLDLDLTPLGEARAVFDRNARLLRAEAAQVSDAVFEADLNGLLQRFIEAPIIYRTPTLAARFDAPARRNLARRLEQGQRS